MNNYKYTTNSSHIHKQLILSANTLIKLAGDDDNKNRDYRKAFFAEMKLDAKQDKRITKQVIADIATFWPIKK
jgi:hypothetical protein